ncbi:MAG: hypothetical protein QXQ95_08765 [Thermofilum sp.]|uniref:hypothetical protein n=1 Tax=Thermofilum sp. TaxID=1961369 RepID=UPI003172BC70
MTVLFVTGDGKKVVKVTASGPSSYSRGTGIAVTVGDLNTVDAVISASFNSGYLAYVSSVYGNVVTVRAYYFDYDAAGDGAAIEVPDGVNLSGSTLTLVCVGT